MLIHTKTQTCDIISFGLFESQLQSIPRQIIFEFLKGTSKNPMKIFKDFQFSKMLCTSTVRVQDELFK